MPQPDTLLEGKYEIVSKLREGGMGTIYLVRHRLLDKIRVIKVLRSHVSADPDLRRRFVDEAKMATRLNHPNLCTIHDFAVDEDATAYIVMEFIEGVNLAELLGLQGPPGVPLSLEIAHQTLLALAYLHRKGVVHRDVAPDNLMLSKNEDGRPLVKIIDLGIAKEADRPIEMTATGVFLGKLRYASPEQAGSLSAGERLDGRSDLYSLGVVLYEILTGVRPFAGNSPAELLRSQLFNPPLPFSQSDPREIVPGDLRAVILKALEKKRDDRYASAEEFDQRILSIQQRLGPEDLESTRALLSQIPAVLPSSPEAVTPSAQSRLNLQFAAGTTPLPSSAHLTLAPTVSATHASVRMPAPRPPQPAPSPLQAKRPPRSVWAVGVAIAAAALAAAVLLRPRPAAPPTETRQAVLGVSPAAPAPAAAEANPTSAPPTAEPTTEPEPTAAPPTRVPPAEPAPRRAGASLKPTRAAIFRPPPTAPMVAAAIVRPTPALEASEPSRPPVAAAPPPERAAAPAAATPAAPAAPASGTSESDRIRDTIRRYEKAQSTLDAEAYARIFPSVDRERIERAFQSLASQSVEFEIRKIQVDPSGAQARVEGYEKRVAAPRAGTEQRASGDRVLFLEKRADGWVIVRLK